MKINIQFLNGSTYWRMRVRENAYKTAAILTDPGFLAKVHVWPAFDFTKSTPGQIADKIASAGELTIKVGFYRARWPWSATIAYEENGEVWFNTRKAEAGDVGNIAHELMHALGFSHDGNSPAGQQNTVPWRVGQWASEWKLALVALTQRAVMGLPV